MAKNRVVFTTTIDKELLRQTRIKAAELGLAGANDVIEMALNSAMAEKDPAAQYRKVEAALKHAGATLSAAQTLEVTRALMDDDDGNVSTSPTITKESK